MKVAIVGHFEKIDEGTRIVARSISKKLEEQGVEVERIDITSKKSFLELRRFKPDIIHYILSPTMGGLVVSKILSFSWSGAKTIISAVHSAVPRRRFLSLFKPDLVMVQSEESEKVYEDLGFRTIFFPNGVDVSKFKPVSEEEKLGLREKYELPRDKFIILHLATMKRERNLEIFKKLKREFDNVGIVLVGRDTEKDIDWGLVKELEAVGCTVWIKHFPSIEEIYNLADCYVFPTIDKTASIETPLSVLEAMACNLPVITTKFGALPRMFKEGNGLFFIEKDEDLFRIVNNIKKKSNMKIRTREKVLLYSWENITKKLVGIYGELLG